MLCITMLFGLPAIFAADARLLNLDAPITVRVILREFNCAGHGLLPL